MVALPPPTMFRSQEERGNWGCPRRRGSRSLVRSVVRPLEFFTWCSLFGIWIFILISIPCDKYFPCQSNSREIKWCMNWKQQFKKGRRLVVWPYFFFFSFFFLSFFFFFGRRVGVVLGLMWMGFATLMTLSCGFVIRASGDEFCNCCWGVGLLCKWWLWLDGSRPWWLKEKYDGFGYVLGNWDLPVVIKARRSGFMVRWVMTTIWVCVSVLVVGFFWAFLLLSFFKYSCC